MKFKIPTVDLADPTNLKNYQNTFFSKGVPVYWQEDVTGTMQRAVTAYLSQALTADQLKLVIAYCQHYIHAPCWLEESPFNADGADISEIAQEITELRKQSLEMETLEDVNLFVRSSLEAGLDPL